MTPTTADHRTGASNRTGRSSVKARLTPNRRRRPVGQRAIELDEAITQTVTGLRNIGYSWAEIAARLGVTRPAAQQRWGHRETEQDRCQHASTVQAAARDRVIRRARH